LKSSLSEAASRLKFAAARKIRWTSTAKTARVESSPFCAQQLLAERPFLPSEMSKRIKVLHIISGLKVGGAEVMLCRLLEHADHSRFDHHVVSLLGQGEMVERVEARAGLTLLNLKGWRMPFGFIALIATIIRHRPHVIQTWLGHAMFFGAVAARLAFRNCVMWCIHTGHADKKRVKRSLRFITGLLAKMSGFWPKRIVSCSQFALERHAEMGFKRHKMQIIQNGTDTRIFRPLPEAGAELRKELLIPKSAPVVGIAGRWMPEKDFPNFFKAAIQCQEHMPDVHFILCGHGLTRDNAEAMRFIERSKYPNRFHLLGIRSDMPRVYSACSIVTLSSASEAFPLTLGEAMACGAPCVATNVGDCREIVGDTGRVVAPGNPNRLARAWEELLILDERELEERGMQARDRVGQVFSMERCVRRYEELYREMAPPKIVARLGGASAPVR
jgi:glycosyltransferase involved in cell wall biosynthesis